jgi:hypothetical protein
MRLTRANGARVLGDIDRCTRRGHLSVVARLNATPTKFREIESN